jgi:hypothetical protein
MTTASDRLSDDVDTLKAALTEARAKLSGATAHSAARHVQAPVVAERGTAAGGECRDEAFPSARGRGFSPKGPRPGAHPGVRDYNAISMI